LVSSLSEFHVRMSTKLVAPEKVMQMLDSFEGGCLGWWGWGGKRVESRERHCRGEAWGEMEGQVGLSQARGGTMLAAGRGGSMEHRT
jgi:hypothetical protein